ncbi:YybH family protein [Psychroserpens algicola]|uniref:DUF4440 domain-containing protein n=1 Tax=Psychroserpens algicola TaxID=1719034 RepID=A0ABT0H7G7_9FLAO|nr:DUF4440 domain-containing protein [Psychroserpens algicola]MCK8479782.1 hypothetical protein [Psychroserpens algicola]
MKLLIILILTEPIFNMSNSQVSSNSNEIFKLTKKANDFSLNGHINKDANQIISVYSENTILLPPGEKEPIKGLEAIKKFYLKGFEYGSSLKITTENISYTVINNSHANEVGKYYIVYQPENSNKQIELNGYMLITWKKNSKGEWKIEYDMWH